KSGHEMSVPFVASGAVPAMTNTRSSSSTSGYGRSMTPSIQLRTAVLAPIPRVRQRIAMAETPGFLRRRRRRKRMSCNMVLDLVRLNQGTERAIGAGHDDCGRRRDGHQHSAYGGSAEYTERNAAVMVDTVFPRGECQKSSEPACGSCGRARRPQPSSHELVPEHEDQDDQARKNGHATERPGAAHGELEPKRDDNGHGQTGGNSEHMREHSLRTIHDAQSRCDFVCGPKRGEGLVERSAQAGGVVEVGQQLAPEVLALRRRRDPRPRHQGVDKRSPACVLSHCCPGGSPAWRSRARSTAAAWIQLAAVPSL